MDINGFIGRPVSEFMEIYQTPYCLVCKEFDGVEYIFAIFPSKENAKQILDDKDETEFLYRIGFMAPDIVDDQL